MHDIAQYIAHDLNAYIINNRPLLLALVGLGVVLFCLGVGALSKWVHQGGEQ